MSLLTNYEGLRHQIERLVRENEELKKLVRLIRENHELKAAIKTQAGDLGITAFSSGLSEVAAGSPPHQGVFLPPSPAAANEPALEEVGIVALTPLADMLSSPQPSPALGSVVSPLTGPLNSPLSGPEPGTQSSPLTSPLTGPLSSHLSLAGVPPGATLSSSLGLPSTGPLTPSSPLAGPPAVSQTGPLLTSTAAPLGVSQNVLANPMSSPVLSEAPRVRLAEPLHTGRTGPHSSAVVGPAATCKVNDARGPRTTEMPRKSNPELERKLTHRKTSKFPNNPRESKQVAWDRLVGEIAFQLDRRILSSIFPERVRLYGFTVSNIPEKIIQASLNPSDHKLDEELCQTLTQRYVSIMNRLQSLGYNGRVHPALTEQLVNAYGILRERPELAASEGCSYTVDFLQQVVVETVHPSMLSDALLLLSCLNQLAHDDGKPMFIW
ncbi:speriolin [Cynocephalus volans]|uniref:speriolin n=1 Tax=Cynocephalus volans TaxID=110931 RepID=UPI002FC9347A